MPLTSVLERERGEEREREDWGYNIIMPETNTQWLGLSLGRIFD